MKKETLAYIETLLWSECDENGSPLDNEYDASDMSPEAIATIEADIEAFRTMVADKGLDDHYCTIDLMHDFVLTRNGHGAGFWDGDYPEEHGKVLTAIAKSFGCQNAYVGDDNLVYVM